MSELLKQKHNQQSSSSVFKVKFQKSNKKDEDTIGNGEKTPIRPLEKRGCHSTPINKSDVNRNMEDSPEIDYHMSPIMGPCTQQNEVVWSWDNPQEPMVANEDTSTPKRNLKLPKRRISESPLMYVPSKAKQKKKLTDINSFLANFELFNNPLLENTNHNKGTDEPSTSKNNSFDNEKNLNLEKYTETSEDYDIKLVYPVDETPIKIPYRERKISDYDDLFDDDINDSMVRCSQQVEEEFLNEIVKQQTNEDVSSAQQEVDNNKRKKEICKIQGLHNLIGDPFEKSKDISRLALKPPIPDDSFDECLSQFEVDDFTVIKKTTLETSQTNGFQARKCNLAKKSLFPIKNSNTKIGLSRSYSVMETKQSAIIHTEKNYSKTESSDLYNKSVINLTKDTSKSCSRNNNSSESTSSPRKFFKSKSLSEPFNDSESCLSYNKNKVTETLNSRVVKVPNVIGKSFRCKIYSDSSLNENIDNANNRNKGESQEKLVRLGNNLNNVQLSNVNRALEKFEEQRTNRSQSTCTPAEIERKRIEAKMKLEAKRRMILSSMITSANNNLPIVKSIKR